LIKYVPEMKKILIFATFAGAFAVVAAYAAVRDSVDSGSRAVGVNQTTQSRVSTRTGVAQSERAADTLRTNAATVSRSGVLRLNTGTTRARPVSTASRGGYVGVPRAATTRTAIASRAATDVTSMSDTRTGAAYTQCKAAYFQCMDQFCLLKNDDYRRCSCSNRISNLSAARQNLVETNEKLTEFTENLDMVGMTAAQATAIHTASDGENALTSDVSASKALLTAIMNSIRGDDANVSGKLADLNSINLSFDTTTVFGLNDSANAIASYNGTELYNAVFSTCRSAVANDCNDASLQRAVNAYLMQIEQDCNTVQTAIQNKQRELKAAIREGSAMLDLARIENRRKHNSDDMTACINNVETAILSDNVCGENYHKCLDNGEFIDVTTGAPITGVVRFYELGNLLKFDYSKDSVDQTLAKISGNQKFVKNFETKTKKFALGALDKCREIADDVWSEYLDKALLDIYYAQQSKVKEIKQGCFDFISKCYTDRDTAITAAMASLIDGNTEISLMPDKIVLTRQMCGDYVESCNNMFDNDIIANYIDTQTDTDTLTACRAVAQQCFDNFGGTNYENFYNPSSGLFEANRVDAIVDSANPPKITALDWFTLYAYDESGNRLPGYKSKCAQRIADIDSCADKVETVFGGLDSIIAKREVSSPFGYYKYTAPDNTNNNAYGYGWAQRDAQGNIDWNDTNYKFQNRRLRPTGVATEVYNQIIDALSTQCMNVQGKFIEAQFIDHLFYRDVDNLCQVEWEGAVLDILNQSYGVSRDKKENICPKDYALNLDINAWGICSCWENGGRRSKNGLISKCSAVIALDDVEHNDMPCKNAPSGAMCSNVSTYGRTCAQIALDEYCTSAINPATNQVCPFDHQNDCSEDNIPNDLPDGIVK